MGAGAGASDWYWLGRWCLRSIPSTLFTIVNYSTQFHIGQGNESVAPRDNVVGNTGTEETYAGGAMRKRVVLGPSPRFALHISRAYLFGERKAIDSLR